MKFDTPGGLAALYEGTHVAGQYLPLCRKLILAELTPAFNPLASLDAAATAMRFHLKVRDARVSRP